MALFGSNTSSMSFVTRRVEYASAIAAPPTMKICPRTPSRASSSPNASSALRILARVKYRSDTIEDLAGHEHAVTRQHRRRVRERVRVELRPARDEPPRLDEALGVVDPRGGDERAFDREQLCDARQSRVEARVAGRRRLLAYQSPTSGARGAPEVVGEP